MEDKDDGVVVPRWKTTTRNRSSRTRTASGRAAAARSRSARRARARISSRPRTCATCAARRRFRRRAAPPQHRAAAPRAAASWAERAAREACWADIEIDEGVLDFEELDEVLGLCGELGYEVLRRSASRRRGRRSTTRGAGRITTSPTGRSRTTRRPTSSTSAARKAAVRARARRARGERRDGLRVAGRERAVERSGRAGHHLTSEFAGREVLAAGEVDRPAAGRHLDVVLRRPALGGRGRGDPPRRRRRPRRVRAHQARGRARRPPWTDASRASAASAMTSSGGPTDLRTMRRCVTCPSSCARSRARSGATRGSPRARPSRGRRPSSTSRPCVARRELHRGLSAIFLWGFSGGTTSRSAEGPENVGGR